MTFVLNQEIDKMKSITTFVFAATCALTLSAASAQDKSISWKELPVKSQTFVNSYFKAENIAYILVDDDLFGKDYEVKFQDGSEVEFDKNGHWKKLEMKKTAVPAALVPALIQQYCQKSFPGTWIKELKKESKKYKVELSNGIDLVFNAKGEFLRIDD